MGAWTGLIWLRAEQVTVYCECGYENYGTPLNGIIG